MTDAASSISVCIRVRPFTVREAAQLSHAPDGPLFLGEGSLAGAPTAKLSQKGIRSVIKVVDDKCLVFDPPEDNPVHRFGRQVFGPQGKRVKDQTFGFDRIFDENVSQGDVYEGTTRNLLDSVLDGYNATVFAYGATGCGKTHTITGTVQQPGIIFLTMQELFERMGERSDEKVSEISLSYLEIYNETIRDLLEPGGSKQGLMLREDSHQTVSVSGLSSHHPKDVQEVMDMIVRGNEYRTMSPTEANATSSRSHAVLQINVSQKDRNASVNEPHTMATLSIIDLAGSERASATKNRGERLIEGANINKSLLALGSCINALCDPRKKNHVPYRNSKLTRLLKFSLGGNCRTVMIVCVSPSSAHFDETQNTLRYANRAKNIQTKVTRNVYNVNRHVKDFLVKIDEQMAMINELKAQQKDYETLAFAKFRKQTDKRECVAREGIARIRTAYDHSASERLEKASNMKKLRQIERRIAMISSWVGAFDQVCESQEDEVVLQNLGAMRKTAQGIVVELEGSRHHYHQKISKSNWERAIDSALQNSLRQLDEVDAHSDCYDSENLTREAEILKSNAEREALVAVAEQEKAGDAALVQVLLRAHFDTMAAVQGLICMDEEAAVQAAKGILSRILQSCTEVTSHVIKPDGSMIPVESFPPTKTGTPKRKKQANFAVGTPVELKMTKIAAFANAPQLVPSPMRASPRRKKFGAGVRVAFTPKKSPHKGQKRGVRWRDDTEDGTLAEFEKTPQKAESTPEGSSSAEQMPPPPLPDFAVASSAVSASKDSESDSSPIPPPPETSADVKPKSSARFKSGFLSKKGNGSPSSGGGGGSGANSSSDTDNSPLRDLEPGQASNRSSLHYVQNASSADSNSSANNSGSDGEGGNQQRRGRSALTADQSEVALKVKSAMLSRRRSLAATAGAAPNSASASSTGALRSHRRRSPTGSSGSPPTGNENSSSLFTASHARRMVGSARADADFKSCGVLSPRTAPVMKGGAHPARRTTMSGGSFGVIGGGVGGGTGGGFQRESRLSSVVAGSGGSLRGSLVGGKGAWR